MVLQNFTGIGVASVLGLEPAVGLLGALCHDWRSRYLHRWAPVFAEKYGISGAAEIGIACATFGLVLASLMGGPIASS